MRRARPPTEPSATSFLGEVACALDESLRETRETRDELVAAIGAQRVQELEEYWLSEPDSEANAAFLQRAAYRERLLVAVWAKLRRLERLRVTAGREAMKIDRCDVQAGEGLTAEKTRK
ncbi:conserved hypothetical protein [Methylocella tundrae]|nr:conserved hypothetical protein [Methylocella tundrae]